MSEGLWIEANSLLVPLRFKKLLGLRGILDTKNDPWIINCFYSPEEGIKQEKSKTSSENGEQYTYFIFLPKMIVRKMRKNPYQWIK